MYPPTGFALHHRDGGSTRAQPLDPHASTPDLRAIATRLGGDIYQGGRSAVVPGPPPHSRKDRSLSLTLSEDGCRVLWFSHSGDPGERVWPYLGLEPGRDRQLNPREAERLHRERAKADGVERARKMAFCRGVWAETADAIGSPVETYLRGRCITGQIPKVIRFHPAAPMDYEAKITRPAMVAIVTAADGKSAAGLHVTALLPDGSGKAALANPRRMYGEMAGAVVQLAPLPDGGELAICEGIETALSYRDLTGTPTWAGLSTSGLRRFMPPHGLKRLVIAADGDGAGIEAARDLAERASRRCDVVVVPAPEGTDWNDALKGERQ